MIEESKILSLCYKQGENDLVPIFDQYNLEMQSKERESYNTIEFEIDQMNESCKTAMNILRDINVIDIAKSVEMEDNIRNSLNSLKAEVQNKYAFSLEIMSPSLNPQYPNENSILNKLNKLDQFGVKIKGEIPKWQVEVHPLVSFRRNYPKGLAHVPAPVPAP
jgi:hypothetical protein